eukprot:11025393-Alexandrium_andersonii.AAC.1
MKEHGLGCHYSHAEPGGGDGGADAPRNVIVCFWSKKGRDQAMSLIRQGYLIVGGGPSRPAP